MTQYATEEELVAKCITSGLVIRRAPHYDIIHPPITLQPTTVRPEVFAFITELQPAWNELMDSVARDYSFLASALKHCAASDDAFTGKLLAILDRLYVSNPDTPLQRAMLGIFRTDYMEDQHTKQWKNVELNAISVSFAGLAPLVQDFHQYLQSTERAERTSVVELSTLPIITRGASGEEVPRSLFEAHRFAIDGGFATPISPRPDDAPYVPVVVFVIQENERNTGDQYLLSIRLLEAHGVRSIRRTMSELSESMQLVPCAQGPPCAVVDSFVVTVFYFRSAYVPQDFINEKCWVVREAIERSSAVKCPSIPYHLAGFKKIQQLLYDRTTLNRYVSDDKAIQLSSTFMAQYALDETEVDVAEIQSRIADAIAHPEKYVLKPQLEGGGNLFAGDAMIRALSVPASDPLYSHVRNEYILMERIPFPAKNGVILKNGQVHTFASGLCSELGVFGTILSTGNQEYIFNRLAGTLVRTKPADVADGGVMAGVAALDSLAVDPSPL